MWPKSSAYPLREQNQGMLTAKSLGFKYSITIKLAQMPNIL